MLSHFVAHFIVHFVDLEGNASSLPFRSATPEVVRASAFRVNLRRKLNRKLCRSERSFHELRCAARSSAGCQPAGIRSANARASQKLKSPIGCGSMNMTLDGSQVVLACFTYELSGLRLRRGGDVLRRHRTRRQRGLRQF